MVKDAKKVGRRPQGSHTSQTTSTALAILSVFVLLIGGLGVAMERSAFLEERPEKPINPEEVQSILERDLDTDLFFLATEAISKANGPNLVQANIIFKNSLKDLFEQRYDPRHFEDYKATVSSYDLRISIMPMSVIASSSTWNISRSGRTEAFSSPAYYRLDGTILLKINNSQRTVATVNLVVDRLIPDITPFLTTRLAEFDANGKSEFADIGRLVRYMLTTLVRFRASQGIGSGPYDTEKDLLNEGDVELAMNMAVLLEEARLFGTYDVVALNAVDHYFFYATDPTQHQGEASWEPYNPTGIRPWGSAERKNYARYQNRMPPTGGSTIMSLFSSIQSSYVFDGTIDPADLMALYLNLDRYQSGWGIDPYDETPILEEKFLFDGRYSPDRRDASHLVYYTQMGPPELVLRDPSGAFQLDYNERLAVDQSPDYLVVGSDLSVTKNITVPWKWMTNTRLSEGSRTGGVPPPQPPPDHDWVMLWEFEIKGDFNLAVGRANEAFQEDGSSRQWLVNRSISLDIPISIFTFLKTKPTNSAMTFTNLNTGSPPGATYNFTLESLAYEHFTNSTWSAVKDIYSEVIADAIRLVKSSTIPYHTTMAQGSNLTTLQAAQNLEHVPSYVWESVDQFVQDRISGPQLSTVILRPFLNSEYFIDVDYIKGDGSDGIRYTLRLGVMTNIGRIDIDLKVADGSTGHVSMSSHLKVDGLLDIQNDLLWDETFANLRPIGSGFIGGDWSLIAMVQGKTTTKAVDVEIASNVYLRLIQEPRAGLPDMTSAIAAAIPVDLGKNYPTALAKVTSAVKGLNLSHLTILFATFEYKYRGWVWVGLTAEGASSVEKMLDWVGNHAETLIRFNDYARLDSSALGTAAAEDLSDTPNIKTVVMTDSMLEKVPLMYYRDASQLFTLQREYPPLSTTVLAGMKETYQDGPRAGLYLISLEYTQYSQVLLSDPEVDYD